MRTCPECGNHDMRVRVVDGAPVHECNLCSARFGDRRAVAALADAEEARQRHVDAPIWPLVRVLSRLPGLAVRSSFGGDPIALTLPFVELTVVGGKALLQLENLAKSLQLATGSLRLRWVIEAEYQHHLAFVLKPRHPGGAVTRDEARDACIDTETLTRQLERDMRLQWWQHPPANGGNGG